MRKSFTIIFLLVLSHVLFSQQTFVKRIDRSLCQGAQMGERSDIFYANNCIYFAGVKNSYFNQSQGRAELYKCDMNGNIVWMKNYSVDSTFFPTPKYFLFKNAIYMSNTSGANGHYGINIAKIDTANGNVLYSKNVELLPTSTTFYDFGHLLICKLDSAHLLFTCGYSLVKFNVITGNVVNAAKFGTFPQLAYFKTIISNTDNSTILSGYLDGGTPFTMKIKNDNQMSFVNGSDFGNYHQLFKKDTKTFIGITEENDSQGSNWFCEFDSSLNLKKCRIPNAYVEVHTGGFLYRTGKVFMHTYGRSLIVDTSYNCLQHMIDFLPWDMDIQYCADAPSGPMVFGGNGIYSVRTNSCGIDYNKSLFIRSDTNLVSPCDTIGLPILFTPTAIPSTNNFTISISQITPTVSVVNCTVVNNIVTDSTYCMTTTDIKQRSLVSHELRLAYSYNAINIQSGSTAQQAYLFDIFGRKLRILEGIQDVEIPYDSEPPGIYFVEIKYTDNTSSKVKILLH